MASEERILNYLGLIHKGTIQAGKAKVTAHNSKKRLIKTLQKQIRKQNIPDIQKTLTEIHAIIDGIEKPLYKSILRHIENYNRLANFMIDSAESSELKNNISTLAKFISDAKEPANRINNSIIEQANILENLRKTQTAEYTQKEIRRFIDLQEEINRIYLQMQEHAKTTLLPILKNTLPKKSFGQSIREAVGLPSKKEIIEAAHSSDDHIKFNVALMTSEVFAILGSSIGPYIFYNILGFGNLISAGIGGPVGDFISGDAVLLPAWYLFNIRKLWAKDASIKDKHCKFLVYTCKLLAGETASSLISYTFFDGPLSAGIANFVHPSIASPVGATISNVPYIAVTNLLNHSLFKKKRAKEVEIEKEIDDFIKILNAPSLAIPNSWWWYKKKELNKKYLDTIKDIDKRIYFMDYKIEIEMKEVEDMTMKNSLQNMKKEIYTFKSLLVNLKDKANILVSNNFMNQDEQKKVSIEINKLRNELIIHLNNIKTQNLALKA